MTKRPPRSVGNTSAKRPRPVILSAAKDLYAVVAQILRCAQNDALRTAETQPFRQFLPVHPAPNRPKRPEAWPVHDPPATNEPNPRHTQNPGTQSG